MLPPALSIISSSIIILTAQYSLSKGFAKPYHLLRLITQYSTANNGIDPNLQHISKNINSKQEK